MENRIDLDRRSILFGASSALALVACSPRQAGAASPTEEKFKTAPERKLTDADWRKKLPEESYRILRHEDTEPPFSGPFQNEKRKGTYLCRGCDLPLFKSEWKFDSGTGWPSFFDVIKDNIGTKVDREIGEERTEYHCAKCLGHHGHVFADGPKPTGLRYCNNGYALKFVAA